MSGMNRRQRCSFNALRGTVAGKIAQCKKNTVPHRYINGGVALPATPDDSREPIHAQETKEVSIKLLGSALLPQIFTEAGENATPAMSRD